MARTGEVLHSAPSPPVAHAAVETMPSSVEERGDMEDALRFAASLHSRWFCDVRGSGRASSAVCFSAHRRTGRAGR